MESQFLKHQETVFETGLALLGIGLLAGLGLLVFGRALGRAQHGRRHAEPAPAAGMIAPERHQHVATVAAR